MTITTPSGFECEVKDDAMLDYRVAKLVAKVEAGTDAEKLVSMTQLSEKLLGADQEEMLIAHLEAESENGMATTKAMMEELSAIMGGLAKAKKNG